MRKLLIATVLCMAVFSAYAAEPTEQELVIFTAWKYKADYTEQPPEAKEEIYKEYSMVSAVAPKILAEGLANDVDYKVAAETIAFEIWMKKYTDGLTISDEDLKKLYEARDINTSPAYSLHNILVKDEKTADAVIKSFAAVKDKKAFTAKFESTAKEKSQDFITREKGGNVGWVELNRLEKSLQEALNDKKAGDIFKSSAGNNGWQIIYVDDYKPSRKASFEEAKPMLTNIYKQVELGKKIKSMTEGQ
ncbi:MAG: peptidylprolyl isomerase [Deferribacterales bacterium]